MWILILNTQDEWLLSPKSSHGLHKYPAPSQLTSAAANRFGMPTKTPITITQFTHVKLALI